MTALLLCGLALAQEPPADAESTATTEEEPRPKGDETPRVQVRAEVDEEPEEPEVEISLSDRKSLQDYKFKSLRVTPRPGDEFLVQDGLGASLSVWTFAKTTGDTQTLSLLKKRRDQSIVHSKALSYSGLGLLGVSGITLLVGLPNKSPSGREDLAYTGLFIAMSGGMLMWIAPKALDAADNPRLERYYSVDSAEDRTEAYNTQLREQLDIDRIVDQQRRATLGIEDEPADAEEVSEDAATEEPAAAPEEPEQQGPDESGDVSAEARPTHEPADASETGP